MGLAALLGGLFFLDSLNAAGERAVGFPATDLVVGGLACLALLVRRRWPVPLAAVLIPVMALSASAMGATAVAIGAVAVYRSWRVTALVVAAHATTVGMLFALAAVSTRDFFQGAVVLLALDAAMAASGLLVRSQRRLVASLRERAREAEERHRLQAEESRYAERERIAREMHDVLAHRLSLLAVHAGALEVRRSAPEAERRAAGVVRECAYGALEDLRAAIGMLRDDAPADADRPQPTLTDLPTLIEQSRLAGTSITLDSHLGDLAAVPDGAGRHVYRVVQEGLTNARKHAPGEPVRVRVTGGDSLVVEITNRAPAATATSLPGASSGLIGLRPEVIRRVMAFAAEPDRDPRQARAREMLDQLSGGERAVAALVGQGRTNQQIGQELLMSTATVKAYMSRILAKLDLSNRVQVALLVHDADEPPDTSRSQSGA